MKELHQLDLELGYRWFVWENLFVEASLGGFVTVGSKTSITPNNPIGMNPTLGLTKSAEDYLDNIFRSYVHAPVIGIRAGWRLF